MSCKKIAIIDFKNQDIGLKILFPEADYFILEEEFDRTHLNNKYNITPIIHDKTCDVYEYIDDKKYDILLIITHTYGALTNFYGKIKEECKVTANKLKHTMNLIEQNDFHSICFFDNYDYDYDPSILSTVNDNYSKIIQSKNILFFKRYFNKHKSYSEIVFPFPYIIFGHTPIIDLLNDKYSEKTKYEKINRIFFSGTLFVHDDDVSGVHRNRRDIMQKLLSKINIHIEHSLPHEVMMQKMGESKYCLDILGVGDPNIRTFEILSCGSLKIAQRTNLKWNFDDDFCEETFFDDENDFYEKILHLEQNPDVYDKCLNKQNEIVNKYMNVDCLKNYLFECIDIGVSTRNK